MGDTPQREKRNVPMENVEEVNKKSKGKGSRYGKRYGFGFQIKCISQFLARKQTQSFGASIADLVLKLEVFMPLKTRWSLQNCFILLLEQYITIDGSTINFFGWFLPK
jgi:hypothetical protein